MTVRRSYLALAVAVWLATGLAAAALAQGFPSRPIELIVPFPPGGVADIQARLIGEHLAQLWGQPILVENRPGAGTVIGVAMAAKASADGHTVVIIANSFVINAKLRANLPYDGLKALDPVAGTTNSPQVIAVNSSSPYRTLKDLIDAASARPGTLSISTVGPATTQHIAVEMFQRAAGVKLVYVPYAGGPLAVNAALGGHVDAVLSNLGEMSAQIEAGKLRALAVTTSERLDSLKQIPTVAESGYPGYEAVAWFGLAAPAGTPREVVAKLADGVRSALNDPGIRRKLAAAGLQPAYQGPSALAAHIAQQYEHYARVIDEAKIKAD